MNCSPEIHAAISNVGGAAGRFQYVSFTVASIVPVIENLFCALARNSWSETWHDPVQSVRIAFILPQREDDPSFELVEPAGPGSPVQDFLEVGRGLHHVCYEVDDLDRAVRDARSQGLVMVRRPHAAVASAGRWLAWFTWRERLLIELLKESCQAVRRLIWRPELSLCA
jgi:methylmalonyl-CoA/ethylmalonyl-CoA epimerase